MRRRQCLRRARPNAVTYGDGVDGAPSDDDFNNNHLGTPYQVDAGLGAVRIITAILNNQPPRVRRSSRVIPGTFFAPTQRRCRPPAKVLQDDTTHDPRWYIRSEP
jgi:hypothetical protein